MVLVAAWFVLPVHVSAALGAPSSEHPALWLIGVLALSVGAPFAAASATAPLLQSWYARTGRADAHDPYYLYAASNLGSFIGLLAYPALIEPMLGARRSRARRGLPRYVVVAALVAFAAVAAIASNGGLSLADAPATPSAAPTWRERALLDRRRRRAFSAIARRHLHISTDVASAPMLWVIPLALYLLTFVHRVRARQREARRRPRCLSIPSRSRFLIVCYVNSGNWACSLSGILTGFFFSALVCHLALSRTRPSADQLTEFYLYVSLGGVIGGALAAFVAPLIFNNVYEYPLALALACLFRPRAEIWHAAPHGRCGRGGRCRWARWRSSR